MKSSIIVSRKAVQNKSILGLSNRKSALNFGAGAEMFDNLPRAH